MQDRLLLATDTREEDRTMLSKNKKVALHVSVFFLVMAGIAGVIIGQSTSALWSKTIDPHYPDITVGDLALDGPSTQKVTISNDGTSEPDKAPIQVFPREPGAGPVPDEAYVSPGYTLTAEHTQYLYIGAATCQGRVSIANMAADIYANLDTSGMDPILMANIFFYARLDVVPDPQGQSDECEAAETGRFDLWKSRPDNSAIVADGVLKVDSGGHTVRTVLKFAAVPPGRYKLSVTYDYAMSALAKFPILVDDDTDSSAWSVGLGSPVFELRQVVPV